MNVWFNYPFKKLLAAMLDGVWDHEVRGHVVRIGPVALCLIWKAQQP
ncbi:MAG TPA: hypothetical protein VN903_36525 [Polyangia bacterium]|nr:hypothetical protein [Polyangia bacterium]